MSNGIVLPRHRKLLDAQNIGSPEKTKTVTVDELLNAYEAEVKKTPLGHENVQRGRSTYNWKMSVLNEILALRQALEEAMEMEE